MNITELNGQPFGMLARSWPHAANSDSPPACRASNCSGRRYMGRILRRSLRLRAAKLFVLYAHMYSGKPKFGHWSELPLPFERSLHFLRSTFAAVPFACKHTISEKRLLLGLFLSNWLATLATSRRSCPFGALFKSKS